jgi:hypothetical protein
MQCIIFQEIPQIKMRYCILYIVLNNASEGGKEYEPRVSMNFRQDKGLYKVQFWDDPLVLDFIFGVSFLVGLNVFLDATHEFYFVHLFSP